MSGYIAGVGADSPSVVVPSEAEVGDVLIAMASVEEPAVPGIVNSGWTTYQGYNTTLCTKIATSSDLNSTVSFDSAQYVALVVYRMAGSSPIDAVANSYPGSTSTLTSPSVTTTQDNDIVVNCWVSMGVQWATSGGPAIRFNGDGMLVADSTQAVPGPSATYTATGSGGIDNIQVVSVALINVSAPNAPTLVDPANTSYQDASSGVPFTATYNSTDGQTQNAYAARIKTSGATAYSYYNASTNALQSTIIWNPVTTAPSANWSWTIPAAAVGNGNTYNWSAASQESGANLQGSFAPDFTFNAQSGPAMNIVAPGGSVTTATPQLTYTATPASGSSVTGGRWLVYPVATTQASGFSIDISAGTIPSGAVSDVSWSGNPLTVGLQSGVTLGQSGFVAYAAITETGGQWSSTVSSPFTVTYDEPAQPSITATASTDPTTGCPLIAVQLNGHDNLLSLADASFEGSVGTWTGTNCVLAVSSTEALDGSDSLSLQIEASGAASAASTTYSVVGSASYVALAAFRPVSALESVQTEVEWFDGSTSLSTVTVSGVEQAGVWVVVPSVFVTPSTATEASVIADVEGGTGQLATPAAPTVTPTGTAGTTSYFYKLVGHNVYGTVTSAEGSTTTGNATLSSTNYNALSWTAETGITSWDVWRGTATGAEDVLVASGLTGTTYDDEGGGTSGTMPTANTTGETHYVDDAGIFPGDTLGYQLEVLSDGPSAYFPLTDAPGSTTAYNAVGSGEGTVNGGVTFGEPGVVASDPSQTAALFDGSTGYVSLGSGMNLASALTLEAFVRTTGPGDQFVILKNASYGMTIDGGQFAAYVNSTYVNSGDTAVNDGATHHVAITWDGTNVATYVDGVAKNGGTVSGPIAANTNEVDIAPTSLPFAGDIAHVAVYPTALSAARIQAHYNAALNTTGQIVQKWTRGGLAGITTVTVTRSDGVYLRGASQVNPASIPAPSQQVTINDYEVTPTVAYTYTAQIQANI